VKRGIRPTLGRVRRELVHALGPRLVWSWSDYADYRRRDGDDRWTARFVGPRAASPRPSEAPREPSEPLVSVILVTYNRPRMLELSVASVLANSADVDYEFIIWDNASTDETRELLDTVAAANPRVRLIHNPANIGLNAVAAAVRLARGAYIVEIDDDVIDVPTGWLSSMVRTFEAVPRAGYLAANVVHNEKTDGAYRWGAYWWAIDYGDGIVVETGSVGGWCAITSRAVIDRIGNFLEMPGRISYGEDGDFGRRCKRAGLVIGVMRNVVVYHAQGFAENDAYGCLETLVHKYADDPTNPAYEAAKSALAQSKRG
jgi:GT2 family glycosyltransferase